MVGNHCIKVLENYPVLTSVLGETGAMYDWMFSTLSDIMKLVMARRFLEDDEIDRLEQLCHSFGAKTVTSRSKFTSWYSMYQYSPGSGEQLV